MNRGEFSHLPLEDRFWKSVAKGNDNECWLWIGHVGTRGYGYIKRNYRTVLAHRISYELAYGTIPKGLLVCHHCDVPQCVNPHHLFIGTSKDNWADMVRKGRRNILSGEKHGSAKLTNVDVIAIRASAERGVDLARHYGVSRACISDIRTGRRWQAANQRAYKRDWEPVE